MQGLFFHCLSLCLHPVNVFVIPSAVLMARNVLEKKMLSSHGSKCCSAHGETTTSGMAPGGTEEYPFSFGEHLLVSVVQLCCGCCGQRKSTQTWETCYHR